MRTRMALALVALLALVAMLSACGGSTEGSAGGTIATPGTDTTAQSRGGREVGGRAGGRGNVSCTDAGITSPPFREGACMERGTRFVVANGRSVMQLRTLKAALRGFHVVESIGSVSPLGVFLVVRLSVQNQTRKPMRFLAGQTILDVGDQRFEERMDVEQRTLPFALAYSRRAPIKPGQTVEGSVVYDIPIDLIETVTREGNLGVANLDGNPPGKQAELGYFRIYAQ